MNTYTLFWLTGQSETVKGSDVASAMNNAGYGAGSIPALDFHAEGDIRDDYVWNKEDRSWDKVSEDLKKEMDDLKNMFWDDTIFQQYGAVVTRRLSTKNAKIAFDYSNNKVKELVELLEYIHDDEPPTILSEKTRDRIQAAITKYNSQK
jgi:hypothetical protein